MAAIAQITVDPAQGPITLVLQSERAFPMQAVLSCRDAGHLDPSPSDDQSIVQWQLSPTTNLYVTYGIVLPLKSVWFAPRYSRQILQNGQLLNVSSGNPRRFTTAQQADGEWVGPPEAFRLVAQGS